MAWDVLVGDEFEPELFALPQNVQDEMFTMVRLLQQFGPQLGRPRVDTLKDSKHANMKELRFDAEDGVWRVAFAFDISARRFYWWPATSPAVARGDSIAS